MDQGFRYSRKTYGATIILASLFFTLGIFTLDKTGVVTSTSLFGSLQEAAGGWAILAVFLVSMVIVSFLVVTRMTSCLRKLDTYNPLPGLALEIDAKSMAISVLIIVICWAPWIILAYPGDVHFDTINQLYQYTSPAPTYYYEMDIQVDAEFLDHHPVFDTLLFGFFIDFGNLIGSQNLGIFTYVLLQVLMTAALLAFSICYTKKLGVPKTLRLAMLTFVALFPPFAQFSATMSKDSLFAVVYLAFFLCIVEVFLSEGKRLRDRRFLALFIGVIVLCLLTKKTGSFVMAISGIALILGYRSFWKQLLAAFLVPLICCSFLIPTFLYPLLDVAPGGKQESMSPLFQQTAAYFIEHGNEVTPGEYEVVSRILEVERFSEIYQSDTVDPVKSTFKAQASTGDLIEYMGVWVSQGLRHPLTYFKATGDVCAAFFLPIKEIKYYGHTFRDDYDALFKEKYGGSALTVEKPQALEEVDGEVQRSYYEVIEGSPILLFLFSDALWAFWLPAACMILAIANNRRYLKVFVPAIVVILFLLLTPMVLSRYMLPLLYTAPLMLALMIDSFRRSERPLGLRKSVRKESPESSSQ